jgi:hypothetical protein
MFDKTRERIAHLEETNETFRKVATHIRTNKKVYLGVGGGLAAGVILSNRADLKQTIGSFNLMYKSTATNIVITNIVRRGHPGYKIVNNITGEVAASIRRMAEMDGRSRTFIKANAKGDNPIYTILGEME